MPWLTGEHELPARAEDMCGVEHWLPLSFCGNWLVVEDINDIWTSLGVQLRITVGGESLEVWIMDEDEAFENTSLHVQDSIELFMPSFLCHYTEPRLPETAVAVLCESNCNEALNILVGPNLDRLVHDYIDDPRCFLSWEDDARAVAAGSYDDTEYDVEDRSGNELFLYVINEDDGFWSALRRASAAVTIQRAWRRRFAPRRAAAVTIERAWRLCRYDPAYTMCSKVQLHNLEELGAQLLD